MHVLVEVSSSKLRGQSQLVPTFHRTSIENISCSPTVKGQNPIKVLNLFLLVLTLCARSNRLVSFYLQNSAVLVIYATTNLEECGRGTSYWNYNAWSFSVTSQQCYIHDVSVSILVKMNTASFWCSDQRSRFVGLRF